MRALAECSLPAERAVLRPIRRVRADPFRAIIRADGISMEFNMGRPRKPGNNQPQIIVNTFLSPKSKAEFDNICDERGMTIKAILGRLITWFAALDKTEQAIVLEQVNGGDFASLANHLVKRHRR